MHPVDHAQAVEAARQRILRVKAGESRKVVYDFDGEDMDNFMYRMMENAETRDLKVLAEEYLALSSLSAPGPSRDAATAHATLFLRNVLSQGGAIQQDYADKPYEEYARRLDCAAVERSRELLAMFAGGTGDDGEAVTEEWLRSIGFFKYGNGCEWIRDDLAGSLFDWLNGEPHTGISWKVGEYWPLENDLKTRGDVRRLCHALGIPTETAK